MKKIANVWNRIPLIIKIAVGVVLGAVFGFLLPQGESVCGLLGTLFVNALKAVAPVLVFVLVLSSIANAKSKIGSKFRTVILLYLLSTFLAAATAVAASFIFHVTIPLSSSYEAEYVPNGIFEVLQTTLFKIVSNPVSAIIDCNYLGILAWALLLGFGFKKASSNVKDMLTAASDAVSAIVRWIIGCAPFGIFGLVYTTVAKNGLDIFTSYGMLLLVLVGSMLFVALVIDPVIASIAMKRNAYPLAFRCLRESGVTAFFTRSSAANIPVNMSLCNRLGLDKDMYSVSIPLGATINMDGAAITITILSLATAYTANVTVDIPTALLLSLIAALGACGASGVAGGSLLLIPMACSLFGLPQDISMQAVAAGMIIGVVQDSLETAINSSGDVLFAATAEYREWAKEGKKFKVGELVNSDEK